LIQQIIIGGAGSDYVLWMLKNNIILGSKAKARSSETKLLRFDAVLGSLITSGKNATSR
jgi:hypothetical protein